MRSISCEENDDFVVANIFHLSSTLRINGVAGSDTARIQIPSLNSRTKILVSGSMISAQDESEDLRIIQIDQVVNKKIFLIGKEERYYKVSQIMTLLPEDSWVMNATAEETLTLITCVPPGVFSHRLVVRALMG